MENDYSTPTPGGIRRMQRPDRPAQPSRTSATPVSNEPVTPPTSFPDPPPTTPPSRTAATPVDPSPPTSFPGSPFNTASGSSSTTPPAASSANPWKYGYSDPQPSPAPSHRNSRNSKKIPKWAIIVPVAIVVLAGLGWAGYTFLVKPDHNKAQTVAASGNQAGEPSDTPPQTTTESGEQDAPVVEDKKVENQPQKTEEVPITSTPAAKEPAPAPQNAPQVTPIDSNGEKPAEEGKQKGSKEYEYGIYTGELLGGLPSGEGTMRYNRRQQISRHDRQKRTAEAGESVTGQWYKGELTNGKLFDKNGALKTTLIIGRAE